MSESARRFGSQSRLRQGIREAAPTLRAREIRGGLGGSDDGDALHDDADFHNAAGEQERYGE